MWRIRRSWPPSRSGQTEYRLGEIFIPVDDPANSADAQHFAETVITELHAGASFALVAAQFSQTQTALEGGELGWEQTNQLDPAVARDRQPDASGRHQQPNSGPGWHLDRYIAGQAGDRQRNRNCRNVAAGLLPLHTPY